MTIRTFKNYAESGELHAIVFASDQAHPAHQEGLLAYDKDDKALLTYNDVEGVDLHIGQAMVVRVINLTAETIGQGLAVRHDGVDEGTDLPKIQLALADTLNNARILGVVTRDIAAGEVGIMTTFGVIDSLDTSLVPAGVPVYLSDTTPGGITETPPAIVTIVGGLVRSDDEDGKLFIVISNTVALPALFGILQEIPDTYDLTTSYQDLDNYQTEDSVSLVVDKVNGIITAPEVGRYRGTFNISLTVPTLASTRSITIQAWDTTHSLNLFEYTLPIPRDTVEISKSMAVPFTVSADSDIVMRIKADVSILGVVIDFISYDIESISLT